MRWSLSLISSWALGAEGRVRQACYRSTPSGEEAKGAEEERREVTGRVFSTPLVMKGRTQSSHVLLAGGGWRRVARKAFSLQDPPRNNGRHSHGLLHQLHTVLSLATALKPVSSPSLAPGPPCFQSLLSSPFRTRPQAGLSTPRADLACLRLTTRPWLRSTVGRRQAPQPDRPGPSDMSPASSPASLSICLPADLTFHNWQTLLLQVGP